MVLGEVLLKTTRSKVEKNHNIYKSTPFQLSSQQLPGCFNQDSQEQIARQIVICRPLVSSGSFPPVQTNKQAALGYGQVGPVVPETGSLELMSKTEQDACKSSAQHHGPASTYSSQASFLPTGYTPSGIKKEHQWGRKQDKGKQRNHGHKGSLP